MSTFVSLTGSVGQYESKRGIRFVRLCVIYPYLHQVWIEVTGDEGREDDDNLTADLEPFMRGLIYVRAGVDDEGNLSALPSWFGRDTPASPSPQPNPPNPEGERENG